MKAKNPNFSQSRATKCRWIPVVLCPPCLSLSLLFCLDLCFIQGRRWSSHSPPLAFASGRRVHSSWETSPGGRGASFFPFIGGSSAGSLLRHGARSLVVARGFRTRSLEGLQGFGGTIVVLSDVGSFLLLSPPILTAGRDGQGHLRGQSCPTNSGSSSEDVRCSDRDRGGHDSGISSCP